MLFVFGSIIICSCWYLVVVVFGMGVVREVVRVVAVAVVWGLAKPGGGVRGCARTHSLAQPGGSLRLELCARDSRKRKTTQGNARTVKDEQAFSRKCKVCLARTLAASLREA